VSPENTHARVGRDERQVFPDRLGHEQRALPSAALFALANLHRQIVGRIPTSARNLDQGVTLDRERALPGSTIIRACSCGRKGLQFELSDLTQSGKSRGHNLFVG